MKTILVTGGLGFIGSHTCVSLLKKEINIFIVDSLFNSSLKTIKAIKKIFARNDLNVENKLFFFEGDIRDKLFLRKVFKYAEEMQKPIDAVIHFAGLKAVGESVNLPLEYWDNNVNGSICLFKVMEEFNCQTIVFSSSASVYGSHHQNKIIESANINPINPYGHTKATIEKILSSLYLSSSKKWRIANLRYFNPIGAHDSGLIGEDPNDHPNNLFPIICRVALGRYEKLKIYGKNWDTKDGTGVRDYIHVMDLAEAHLSSLDYLLENKSQLITLNIGTGIATSVLDLVKRFIEINNCSIPYEFAKRRKGDSSFLVANNQLALSTINWRPKKNLDDMCRDGWKFYAKE